jgi:mRNA interferase RelE/StbE
MWEVRIPKRVDKELSGLPVELKEVIEKSIQNLKNNPYPVGIKKLQGHVDTWRIEIRRHRILYEIHNQDKYILIVKIGPRKDVYRFLN